MKRILAAIACLGVTTLGLAVASPASATSADTSSCVPTSSWDETVHHPATTHVVHHDAVTHVAHHEAVVHTEYSYQKQQKTKTGWVDFHARQSGFYIGWAKTEQSRVFYAGAWRSIDQEFRLGDGTYRWHEYTKSVTDRAAYDETVTDHAAYDETVTDHAAYDETVHHAGTYCDSKVFVNHGSRTDCDGHYTWDEYLTTTYSSDGTPMKTTTFENKTERPLTVGELDAYNERGMCLHPTPPTPPTPPVVHHVKHFTPHIRVVDRCRCKHDSVIVRHSSHIQSSVVRQVNKTKWIVRLVADEGHVLPKNIQHPRQGWARSVTYHFHTTNKPCPCEATGCHTAPAPKPSPAPVPCDCKN